jgi:hypothetical protein
LIIMSNEISLFQKAGLPAPATLATALKSLDATVGAVGVTILKMDKTGHWVFGADQTEVEEDSTWAVNPFSFVHGYIAWGPGEVLGEAMAPVTQPLPEIGPAPEAAKKGWEKQVGFSLKCVNGEDAGLEVRYTVTSVGGKRAVQGLAAAIAAQVETNPDLPVPVVRLKKEHYQHKEYGRIFTPIFEIVGWVNLDGKATSGEAAAAEAPAADEAAPGRRRRRA